MAKQIATTTRANIKIRRKGVHAKTQSSHLKSSKLYKKKYKGQGR